MADARRPLDFSRDIWSCISEFKGNTTITIQETSWVDIPSDFHGERKSTCLINMIPCKHQQCQWGQMENQRLSITRWQDTNNIFCQINNICLSTFKSLLRQYYSKTLHSCFDAGPKNMEICMFKLWHLSKFELNIINLWVASASVQYVVMICAI
jgi:hypothetical protein